MKKALALAAGILISAASTPAFAVASLELPNDDVLFIVECDNSVNDNQLYSVDAVAATVTAVGDGQGAPSEDDSCASQGAQLPGTDWFYYVDWDGGGVDYLNRNNLVTGDVEVIGALTVDGVNENNVLSLAIGPDGSAYVLTYDECYSIDLETGDLTLVSTPDFYGEYSGYPYGFAYDYVTEKFYVVEDGDGALYEFDPESGNKVELDYNGDWDVLSMSFDSAGNLWANGFGNYVATMALGDFGDSDAWVESSDLTPSVDSESIWVSFDPPAEELADTGFGVAPLGALGALTVAGGVALAVRRRRA